MNNFTTIVNSIQKEYDMADSLIKSSKVLSKTNLSIQDVYKERGHKNEGTHVITLMAEEANKENYKEFVDLLEYHKRFYNSGIDERFVNPTLSEFINRRYEDGRKIGKVMRKCGFKDSIIDTFSEYDIVDSKDVYLTITGAPQYMVGVSAFSTNDWDSYSGSSCLDVTKNEPNQIHVLGLLSSPRFFVAFTHDKDADLSLENKQRIMKTRVILFVDDDGELHFNSKAYGSTNKDKQMIKECLYSTGLAKGVMKYIDDDMVDEDDFDDTYEYLQTVDKSYDIKRVSNVFQPIKLTLAGAYRLDGVAIIKSEDDNGDAICTCPHCQVANDEGDAVISQRDFSNDNQNEVRFSPDASGNLGVSSMKVKLDKCFLCGGTGEIKMVKEKYGFNDFYYRVDGHTSYSDHLTGSHYQSKNHIKFYCEYVDTDDAYNYETTVSMYPEGSFYVDGDALTLIFEDPSLKEANEEKEKVTALLSAEEETLDLNSDVESVTYNQFVRSFLGGQSLTGAIMDDFIDPDDEYTLNDFLSNF